MFEIRPQMRAAWPLVGLFIFVLGSALALIIVKGIDSPRDVLVALAIPIVGFFIIYVVLQFSNSRFAVVGDTVKQTNAFRKTTAHEPSQIGRMIFAHHVTSGLARPNTNLIVLKPDGKLLFRLTSPMWSALDITAFLNATGRVAEVVPQPISVTQLRAMSPSSASWHEAKPWMIPLAVIVVMFGIPLVIGLALVAVSIMAR